MNEIIVHKNKDVEADSVIVFITYRKEMDKEEYNLSCSGEAYNLEKFLSDTLPAETYEYLSVYMMNAVTNRWNRRMNESLGRC